MKLVLEKIIPKSAQGNTASVDFFDATGILLLKKGQPITKNILERLEKREIYVLCNNLNSSSSSKLVKAFPKDIYVELASSLWSIYHEAKLIKPEQIEKTMVLVEVILGELKNQSVYFNFHTMCLNVERFKQHDYGTFRHILNVALLSAITGIQLGYAGQRLKYLTTGALLHDLGKLKAPMDILNKPSGLTEDEYSIVKNHPLDGADMLRDICLPDSVIAVVKEHQERWNGKGYPLGLKGKEIHFNAQIIAVADVYEALTADRPYRPGIPPYHALEMIIGWSGEDFNPEIVQAFRESLVLYPENAIVTLNTGEKGIVITVPLRMPTRPLIRLLFDRGGKYLNCDTYVDLMKDLTQFVVGVEFNLE
ncbi:C-di-GMP phosphodiesterase [Candidatus Desulfosporosinus infrequens]|uniref:C-di-GMP phosphodiesterase n=1 Tax=Candidatus Desulfosporosinus infrequens TaxID=2043169 RepID=A0A2U3JWL6_9FIRM|nr:C-di-GMP phosphodiesterase [Candidatus Desulfosporosinus infrequens]